MRNGPPLSQILFGLVFAGMGWLSLYLFGQATVLTCARDGNDRISCLQEARWLGKLKVSESQIYDLRGAWVEDNCDSDGCTYRVVLSIGSGSQPLTKAFSSGEAGKQKLAEQINAFCKSESARSVEIQDKTSWMAVLVTGTFVVVGLGIAFVGARNLFQR